MMKRLNQLERLCISFPKKQYSLRYFGYLHERFALKLAPNNLFTNNSQKYWELLVNNASESAEGNRAESALMKGSVFIGPNSEVILFFHLVNLGRYLGLIKLSTMHSSSLTYYPRIMRQDHFS